jgi:hypothetical protein
LKQLGLTCQRRLYHLQCSSPHRNRELAPRFETGAISIERRDFSRLDFYCRCDMILGLSTKEHHVEPLN